MRHAAQCVGRCMRGKTDYGIMCLADKVKLSSWKAGPALFNFRRQTIEIKYVPLQVRIMEMLLTLLYAEFF